jgi:hypothetical protein
MTGVRLNGKAPVCVLPPHGPKVLHSDGQGSVWGGNTFDVRGVRDD